MIYNVFIIVTIFIMENDSETLCLIKEINEKIKVLEKENSKYQKQINENKNLIKEKERVLWNKCEHNWVRDPACSDDDLCKKYCSICLLRNCYLF